MNPYFVAYAKSNGNTPEAQLASEPNMIGFICWIGRTWAEFDAQFPQFGGAPSATRQKAFAKWLEVSE